MSVDALLESIPIVFSLSAMAFLIAGLILGIILGALPGMGGIVGMVLLLPLTFPLSGYDANIMLVAIYSGALYGSSIAAILINVPGSAASAATTIDGYPLTKQGRASEALALSATASAIGGGAAMIVLFAITPVMADIVKLFGSPEIALLAFLGIAMIAVVAKQGSLLKGLVAGIFGLMVTAIGIAPQFPTVRYGLGLTELYDGLDFIAILIGMFAIGEMLRLANQTGSLLQDDVEVHGDIRKGVRTVLANKKQMFKASTIGMVVGAVPGAGASAANFIAYAEAVRSAKGHNTFGDGDPVGVIASEASNNASVAGSLVPTFSFGIPGSAAAAVLLGGFLMHGVEPGPELFNEEIVFTYSLYVALLISNVFILVLGLTAIPWLGERITQVNTDVLIPVIIVLAALGAIMLRQNWIDIVTIFVFGIIAYLMYIHNYSVIAVILGAVLGPIVEPAFSRTLRLSGGGYGIFLSSPIAIILTVLIVLLLFGPFLRPYVEPYIP